MDLKSEDDLLEEEDLMVRKKGFEELWNALRKKKRILAQKSRLQWSKLGDANTRFFHRVVRVRRGRNTINDVINGERWVEDPVEVKGVFRDHFEVVF